MAVYNESVPGETCIGIGAFSHLVLEVDGSIEVWDLRIDRLADDFSFAGVKEGSHF
jgi:hypothetical protein